MGGAGPPPPAGVDGGQRRRGGAAVLRGGRGRALGGLAARPGLVGRVLPRALLGAVVRPGAAAPPVGGPRAPRLPHGPGADGHARGRGAALAAPVLHQPPDLDRHVDPPGRQSDQRPVEVQPGLPLSPAVGQRRRLRHPPGPVGELPDPRVLLSHRLLRLHGPVVLLPAAQASRTGSSISSGSGGTSRRWATGASRASATR